MPVATTESGESSKLFPANADAEYPCVRRLRHRRLLTFLWLQGHEAALAPMIADSVTWFSVPYLRRLVEQGQSKAAVAYLLRFLPPGLDDSLGLEAQVLRRFLVAHMVLASILYGGKEDDVMGANYRSMYLNHDSSVRNGTIRLRSIMLTALYRKHQLSASLDWECVKRKAAEIVDDLAYRTPELKDVILKPGGPMKPHNVLPIGFSYRRRAPNKKQPHWQRASSVAKGYIRKKRSLLSSNRAQESRDAMLNKAMDMVADAVDKSLKAGMRPKLKQEHPLQPSGREGPAKNPGIPSASNAGKLASRVPMLGGRFLGPMFIAPVSPAVPGILPSHLKHAGCSLMTNTGVPVAPVSQSMSLASNAELSGAPVPQSMNLTSHAGMSGATVAPVPQTMIGSLPSTANITGMPSMENTDKLMRHGLSSGAPFSRMMFGSAILQTMSGRPKKGPPGASAEDRTQVAGLGAGSRNHSGSSAPLNAVTQAMFGTMAGPARNHRMPSVANAGELASHVQSAGVPVSQTAFGCLTNPAKNSDISLMTDAENAHQSSARKNIREELTSNEQDLHQKCQWTTGTFDEADLVKCLLDGVTEIEAEAREI